MKPTKPSWLEWVLNLLYPPRCGVCHRFEDNAICDDCLAGWQPITPPYCLRCGRPFEPLAKTSPLCGLCLQGYYRFDGARSAIRYEGIGRETVHAFKFHRKPRLAQPMGERMAQVLERAINGDGGLSPEGWPRPDFLVPVPLHRDTLHQRGYNQSALLAQVVGEILNIPVAELVEQIRPMRPQMSLGEKERWENVRGAFAVTDSNAVKGCILVVVDDVMTTGATLHEVARIFKQSGARRVYCLIFARTVSL